MRPLLAIRPDHVCPNCFATWKAAKPRPSAIYCHHAKVVAWRVEGAWRTEPATDSALRSHGLLMRLRAELRS